LTTVDGAVQFLFIKPHVQVIIGQKTPDWSQTPLLQLL
jgi:hypothetical protein